LAAPRRSRSPAIGRFYPRASDFVHLDTDARVRSAARAVAAHQGSRNRPDKQIGSAVVMMKWIEEASPNSIARIAAVFYLMVFLTGSLALISVRGRLAANLIATVCYIVVTLLFYVLFKPVNKSISLLAAFFGLLGCGYGLLTSFRLA